MATGKPFSGWLSGDLLKKATDRVNEDFEGNSSRYVVELIKADIERRDAAPKLPNNASVLVELARHYHPTLTEELEPLLANRGINQKRAIARLLEAFAQALKDPAFDPASEVSLVDEKTRQSWQGMSDSRIVLAARELATHLNEKGAEALLGARDAIVHGSEPETAEEKERAEALYRHARKSAPGPAKQKRGPGKVAEA